MYIVYSVCRGMGRVLTVGECRVPVREGGH